MSFPTEPKFSRHAGYSDSRSIYGAMALLHSLAGWTELLEEVLNPNDNTIDFR